MKLNKFKTNKYVKKNCRFLFCGDFAQNDLDGKKEKSGYLDIMRILKNIDDVDLVFFTIDDIVRSGFVKEYLKQKQLLGF
jgi:phosphate starvation-inducible PhoH-like protein